MKYLVNVTETYRVDTEAEAKVLIENAKADSSYGLTKYNCEHKVRKQKGEIVDEWYKVVLLKAFNEEKEPTNEVTITYEVE